MGCDVLTTLVVIPTRGTRPDMLREAVESVHRQTVPANQIVIANGGGTLSDRLNDAIGTSPCESYVMLSDDDTLEPQFLEKTSTRMANASVEIVNTRYTHFGTESCVTGSENHISVTSLFRKSAWEKAGGYKEVPCFDYDFVLTCIETGATRSFIDEPLWRYRIHASQEGNSWNIKAATKAVLARHPWATGEPEDRFKLLK